MSILSGRIDSTHPSKERRLCLKDSVVWQILSSSPRLKEKLRSSERLSQICRELNDRLGDGDDGDDQPACCLQDLENFLAAVLHIDNKLGLILDKAVRMRLMGACLLIHKYVYMCECTKARLLFIYFMASIGNITSTLSFRKRAVDSGTLLHTGIVIRS